MDDASALEDVADAEIGAPGDAADSNTGEVSVDGRRAWATFEATLDLEVPEGNPFDPAQAEVVATFTDASGSSHTVDAFVYRPFTRALVDGREQVVEAGPPEWRVRFRPPFGSPEGEWRWEWRAEIGGVESSSEPMRFAPVEDPTGRGLVVRSAEDWRYLVHEDGSPYFAVGENMAWADGRGTFAYDDWMGRLAAVGANFIRVWMPSWGFGLEWTIRGPGGEVVGSTLGDYGARLDRAWQLDQVLDAEERLGITVMLNLQNHGPFSTLHASEWDRNPYNALHGGPLDSPRDVFSNAEARGLFARRLRYIVARWGHSPAIMAWELFNEFDLVTAADDPAARAWLVEMAAVLRRHDRSGRLVTTSLGGLELFAAWVGEDLDGLEARFDFWEDPGIDLTQIHFYGALGMPIDFASDTAAVIAHLRRFGKPMLVGEAGVNALGADETRADDPGGVGFHDILWAGLFAETFGTGMSWWWDLINAPENYDPQFAAVADFVRGVAFHRERFVRSAFELADGVLLAQVLAGESTLLAWVKDRRHQWFAPADAAPAVLSGAQLSLPDAPSGGTCAVVWRDPWTGDVVAAGDLASHEGASAIVEIPTFTRDLALRIDCR